MASFTLDGKTFEHLNPDSGDHPEDPKPWIYGKYPKVLATVPLADGGTVRVYRVAERWDPSHILVSWADDRRHSHWAWIPAGNVERIRIVHVTTMAPRGRPGGLYVEATADRGNAAMGRTDSITAALSNSGGRADAVRAHAGVGALNRCPGDGWSASPGSKLPLSERRGSSKKCPQSPVTHVGPHPHPGTPLKPPRSTAGEVISHRREIECFCVGPF